ncbi:hypothetical protein LCGC14_2353560, partial [marine sediment metagenome]
MEKIEVSMVVHFTDGTKLPLSFPRQAGDDPIIN